MSVTSKTVRILQRLAEGNEVNAGVFSSAQQKEIIDFLLLHQGVTFFRKGKIRGSYVAPNKDRFLELCGQYDTTLRNLEAAARLAAGGLTSRADKVSCFGNSKQDGVDRTVKGFTLLADRQLTVSYLGAPYCISPLAGLHVVYRDKLSIPKSASVVVVENPECFYDLRWIPNVGLKEEDGPFIVLCYFPICEEAKLWLERIQNNVLYFGDFDLAGIRIYETQFKRRLGKKITFIQPEDVEDRIKNNGNPTLYDKHINEGFSKVSSSDGELTSLIKLIHSLHSCYEQEGYCRPL